MNIFIRITSVTFTILCLLPSFSESIWIESESAQPFPEFATTGSAKPEWISGEKLLSLNLNPKQIEEAIPQTGLVITYPFTVKTTGEFFLWNRVVFENIRAPFEWRVNQGEWMVNSQLEQPISNVQELGFWNPIGWTLMGKQVLSAGTHTLDIRLRRDLRNEDQKEIRYVSDAIHITSSPWRPYYRFRPGQVEAPPRSRFELTAPVAPRVELDLTGTWHFAPYDEFGEITEESRISGTRQYPNPDTLTWSPLPIPSDRNTVLPEARFAHRFVLRTTVEVPEAWEGAGFQLEFEALNMISSLFVNGTYVGEFSIPKSRWVPDISSFLRAGSNEILLVVKDSYYGLAPSDKGVGMRSSQYFPESLFNSNQGVSRRMDFPVANGHGQAGILDTARLIATRAPVYVADTFVKPYPITRQEIEFDTTLYNAGDAPTTVTLQLRVRDLEGTLVTSLGDVELKLPAKRQTTHTLSASSKGFTLWEMFDPTLYQLEAGVKLSGESVDRHMTRFGVREWEVRGNQFYLNGIRRHLRSDLTHYNPEAPLPKHRILSDWKELGLNMFRRRFQFPWNGISPRGTLSWMDEVGMPVRMNGATFDGQVASYNLVEGSGDNRTARRVLFDRWRAQMLNGVDTFKNHPSVFIWELDNELIYINARNFGLLGEVEPEFTRTSNEIMAKDPTRATVIGGGGALKDQSLPTYGIHYYEIDDRHYPDEAYTGERALALEGSGEKGRVWPVDFEAKPFFFSETAFLPGRSPAQFAAVGGEVTFLGKRESREAAGLILSWINEGYRWKGYAANHIWVNNAFTDGSWTYAWQPVAILRREWNQTFAPGQKVTRSLRLYNDEVDTRPLDLVWALEINGRTVAGDRETHTVPPGEFRASEISFTLPSEVRKRSEGRIRLRVERAGETVFERFLPAVLFPEPELTLEASARELLVWDPQGNVAARLRKAGGTVRSVQSLSEIPDQFGVLVVGPNAIPAADATNPRWTALAASGNRILVLEQEHPLHFQALPADVSPSGHDGTIAFPQNLEHPVFQGLAAEDFRFWGEDHVVYRNALRKAARGAVSLVQCDDQLGFSALSLAHIDDGLIVMSQLALGEKLTEEVVARQMFDNLFAYTAGYTKTVLPVQTLVKEPHLQNLIGEIGVNATARSSSAEALAAGGVVIMDGTAEQLEALTVSPEALARFWEQGGWLIVNAITPDSLEAFNKLMEVEHLIRPFREELVRFPATRHPLSAGLTLRDVVMTSGKRIQSWNRDEWPSNDAYDYIVDLDEIAPFAEFPPPAHWNDSNITGPGNDAWPLNMVNGFTADTHWRMVFSIHLMNNDPTHWSMKLPREEIVTRIVIRPNRIYHQVSEYQVRFPGEKDPRTFAVDPTEEVHSLNVEGAPPSGEIELRISKWVESGNADVVGVDNLEIFVKRPDDFARRVRPLLNVGGLIEYPRGEGGVVLNQLVIREREANPANEGKKKVVFSTILRNLGADFGGRRTAVPGFNLNYRPVSLEGFANTYLTRQQGWPANGGDLSGLPRGAQRFAGVQYTIRDFETSPLESGVALSHPNLKTNATAERVGPISVGERADSLFFLHSFLQHRGWKPRRATDEPPVLFQYVVRYADGEEVPVEITLGQQVDAWLQETPSALPEAAVAWTGNALQNKSATVYQFQWNNPRPDIVIESVELQYAEKGKNFGSPLLLGITSAKVRE